MIFAFGDFQLDTGLYELRHLGRPRKVEPQVFDLLHCLLRHHHRVVGREEIVAEVWEGRAVSEATISTCLKGARQAIGDDGRAQSLIQTVRGRGLRFVGKVIEVPAAPSGAETPARQAGPGPGAVEPATAAAVATPVGAVRAGTDRPTVAVLPFDNLGERVDEYFADGLTEDIISALSRFRELQVIARTSTFRFKGQAVDLRQVGAELGAGYVVVGSVRRVGSRVRITTQLIETKGGVHVWADRYDRDMEDIFAVQDEVTQTVAAALGVSVQDAALQRALRKSPAELDAYDCLLRARRYTITLGPDEHVEARDLLERAVALDPTYADAHALLANVYLAEHRFDANPRPDAIGRALAAAQAATRLDPQNAYARCWLAICHFFRRENAQFEVEAQRALGLNPNDPETLADIGHYLAFMGEFERGVALTAKARRLNPLHPGWYHFSFARAHYNRREYEATLADVERIAMPHFYWTHLLEAAALGQMGRPGGREALDRIDALKPGFSARAELEKWNAAPDDLEHLLDGLRRAGLEA
jgi:TolB-like protein/DNA-binding winged helix-turn-helix (wHTH) protein/tetratricopeptide (TPR) repeat protein